jgi:hypothetical protein
MKGYRALMNGGLPACCVQAEMSGEFVKFVVDNGASVNPGQVSHPFCSPPTCLPRTCTRTYHPRSYLGFWDVGSTEVTVIGGGCAGGGCVNVPTEHGGGTLAMSLQPVVSPCARQGHIDGMWQHKSTYCGSERPRAYCSSRTMVASEVRPAVQMYCSLASGASRIRQPRTRHWHVCHTLQAWRSGGTCKALGGHQQPL